MNLVERIEPAAPVGFDYSVRTLQTGQRTSGTVAVMPFLKKTEWSHPLALLLTIAPGM